MIHYFNAPFLYWENCDNHAHIKKSILPIIEEDYKKNKDYYRKNNYWQCKCTSSFHTKIDGDIDTVNKIILTEDLVNAIFVVYNNMLQKLLSDGSIDDSEYENYMDCYIDDIWYNYYQSGENQEIHEHTPNIFSGVYLLELSGELNNTIWYNGGSTSFVNDSTMLFGPKKTELHNVGEGNILIFPSALPHYVPNTNEKKITLSFNIRTNYS